MYAAVEADTSVNLIPTAFLAFCNLACLFNLPPVEFGVAVKDGIVASSLVVFYIINLNHHWFYFFIYCEVFNIKILYG